MNEIFNSLQKSLMALFRPELWVRLVLPWMISFILAFGILIAKWSEWMQSLNAILKSNQIVVWLTAPLQSFWISAPEILVKILSGLLIITSFFVIFYVVALVLMSWLVIPLLVPLILKKDFRHLENKKEHSVVRSSAVIVVSFIKYIAGFIVTIPLWLIPGMAFFLPVCWNGYLASQIFPMDVLQGIANTEEIDQIRKSTFQEQWIIGVMTSMIFLFPGINLLAPALMPLVFIYFNLAALQKLRASSQSV